MLGRMRGFTLVELMIVVAIIAIIAAVGFPSYQDSVRKSKRAEAKSRLLQLAQLQERKYSQGIPTYVTDISSLLGLGANVPVYSSDTNDPNSGYVITAAAGATGSITDSFVLTATRQAAMAGDAECGELTLSNTGQKNKTGTGTLAKCWG